MQKRPNGRVAPPRLTPVVLNERAEAGVQDCCTAVKQEREARSPPVVSIRLWDSPHFLEPILRGRVATRRKEALEFSGLTCTSMTHTCRVKSGTITDRSSSVVRRSIVRPGSLNNLQDPADRAVWSYARAVRAGS
jgi:hypothetical protein